jgi:transcriptional regulator with XRE-family HTH domain
MTPAQRIAARVVQLRAAAGLSQVELADEAGMSKSQLCRLERAKRPNPPTLATLQRIADALEVQVAELLG